jgi:hypothetical protein
VRVVAGERALAALKELVRLKAVKERLETLRKIDAEVGLSPYERADVVLLEFDYESNKRKAWDAAKAVFADCPECGKAWDAAACWELHRCPRLGGRV